MSHSRQSTHQLSPSKSPIVISRKIHTAIEHGAMDTFESPSDLKVKGDIDDQRHELGRLVAEHRNKYVLRFLDASAPSEFPQGASRPEFWRAVCDHHQALVDELLAAIAYD